MALLVGAFLAFAVGLLATGFGLDRDRAFYPTVTIVIGSYYALFAVMGASTHALVLESLVGAVFLALALSGFRSSLWVVVAALAAHGIFDLAHGKVISNPGVPGWWPEFCLTYDVTAAGYLAWLLTSGRLDAATKPSSPGRSKTPIQRRVSFALAVVFAAAALACSSREEKKVSQVDADEVAQDNEALDQLRAVGSDLSKPHQIDFYLYLPSEADARAAEAALRPMGYSVTVSVGENNASWLCLASRTMMPTIPALSDARSSFKGLALRHRGAYDGWRAAIVR